MRTSPEAHVRIRFRQRRIPPPPPPGGASPQAERDRHGDEELPDPCRAPLRHPERGEEDESPQRDGPREQPEHEADAESYLREALHRPHQSGVARDRGHHALPEGRGAPPLGVRVNQPRVIVRRVQVLAHVLKKHPDEHGPERHAQKRQRRRRRRPAPRPPRRTAIFYSWFIAHENLTSSAGREAEAARPGVHGAKLPAQYFEPPVLPRAATAAARTSAPQRPSPHAP